MPKMIIFCNVSGGIRVSGASFWLTGAQTNPGNVPGLVEVEGKVRVEVEEKVLRLQFRERVEGLLKMGIG